MEEENFEGPIPQGTDAMAKAEREIGKLMGEGDYPIENISQFKALLSIEKQLLTKLKQPKPITPSYQHAATPPKTEKEPTSDLQKTADPKKNRGHSSK